MAISPDEFVELVITEAKKYQNTDVASKNWPGLGLYTQARLYGYQPMMGLLGGSVVIQLADSSVRRYDTRDTIEVGVDYELSPNPETFDQSAALQAAQPRGVISYLGLKSDEKAHILFDLHSEKVTGVIAQGMDDNQIESIEGMDLHAGVSEFARILYASRGISPRE